MPPFLPNYLTGITGIGIAGSGKPAGGAAAITYDLRASFTAANQSFSDAQVLDTEAEGVQDGSLVVSSADLSIASNKLSQSGANLWERGIISGSAITGAAGKLFKMTISRSQAGPYQARTGFSLESALNASALHCDAGFIHAHNDELYAIYNSNTALAITACAGTTEYEYAVVLGGYDSSGVPGVSSSHTYGYAFWAKGGSEFTDWTLIYRISSTDYATSVYPYWQGQAAGATYTAKDLKVPTPTYPAILQPAFLDTFTDSNGTSLDAHTPDVGSGWTEQNGVWEIQSNRADVKTSDATGPRNVATVETGESDIYIEFTLNQGGSGSNGLVYRYVDNDNFDCVLLGDDADNIQIYERISGTFNSRASTAISNVVGTDYNIKLIASGATISAWVDDAAKVSYASASANQSNTKHGLRAYDTDPYFDNFHIMPLTSTAQYSDVLDAI